MTQNHLVQLYQTLDQWDGFDLNKAIADTHQGLDLKTTLIGELPVTDFVALLHRIRKQLRAQLEGPNVKLLPVLFYWQTPTQSMAQHDLLQTLPQFWSHLSALQWTHVLNLAEILVGYQMSCGFWEQKSKPQSQHLRNRQDALFSELEVKAAEMDAAMRTANIRGKELEALTTQRKTESEEIATYLSDGARHQQQISVLLNQATAADASITQIQTSQQTNLAEAKTLIGALGEKAQTLEVQLRETAEKLKTSATKLAFMEEKEKWVKDLAGIAAETGLGRKFEARKKELSRSAWFWLVVVILATGGAAYWLFNTHKWLWTDGNKIIDASNIWMVVGVNLGLLVPVIVGLGFAIRQYGKERHYQEEYAFRASVAMTTSAFADRLSDDPVERDKLVKETIEKLFELPLMLREQPRQGVFGPSKALKESMQAVTDLVKEIKKS